MTDDLQADIEVIDRIPAVPTILDVVCRTTGMGFAAVARVTESRWIACSVKDEIQFGLKPGGELKVETTICHEVRQHRDAVIINHVAEDDIYCRHHTPAMYGFQSYISMPILLPDGTFFGTLCALDPKPHKLNTPEVIGMFKLFAELIAFHLDALSRLATTEANLSREREVANLRELFVAVLGHDLRSPLQSIVSGMERLRRQPEQMTSVVPLIVQTVQRMAKLIDNVLDFARGRLGGGITLASNPDDSLASALSQIVDEVRSSSPDRVIEVDMALAEPVNCDRARIGQLFSNLLGNAVTHGAQDRPIGVTARAADGVFELSVSNGGEPIPPAAQGKLFQPFFRATEEIFRGGLGLGLYIASEIAHAHGGKIDVTSTAVETRFTFRMPTAGASLTSSAAE